MDFISLPDTWYTPSWTAVPTCIKFKNNFLKCLKSVENTAHTFINGKENL